MKRQQPLLNTKSGLLRKDAIPIQVKREVVKRIKQRQLLDKLSPIEKLLREGNWFMNTWDGLVCLC